MYISGCIKRAKSNDSKAKMTSEKVTYHRELLRSIFTGGNYGSLLKRITSSWESWYCTESEPVAQHGRWFPCNRKCAMHICAMHREALRLTPRQVS